MQSSSGICSLVLCLLLAPAMLCGQAQPNTPAPAQAAVATATNPKTAEEFFARARQLQDLEAAGIPFHLKATYVATGDVEFTGNGTYEIWWQSKDVWRKEATLGTFTSLTERHSGSSNFYSTSTYVPLRLRQVFENMLVQIPIPSGASPQWKAKQKTINGVEFTVLIQKTLCGRPQSKLQCMRQYYFNPAGMLQIHAEEAMMVLYNDFHPFQTFSVPHSIILAADGNTLLTISIVTLNTLGSNELMPPADVMLKGLQKSILSSQIDPITSPGVTPAKVLSTLRPVYPTEAKMNRNQGTVVMKVTIDDTGKIREPYVIHSAGKSLDEAALTAVRGSSYQPLRVDGIAIPFITTVSVEFSLD